MLRCVILAAVILLVSAIEERASLTLKGDNALVTQFPTIMTHDAATGMLDSKRKGLVNSYTQTQQDGTFADQLRCGARSFDFRPYLKKNGDVISHHGVMKIDTLMSDMMQEITDWLSEDQNSEELVILYVSHYDGDGDDAASKCSEAAESVLKDMGMTNIIHEDECAKLDSYTVGAAKQNGKLASGGSVLVVNQPCVSENYDPTVNCWGFSDKKEYSCFGKNKDLAWDSIAGYMNNTNWKKETGMWYVFKEGGCCTHETDMMLQAHWQSTSASMALGDLHLSSVLKDESAAGVNAWIASQVINRALPFEYLNIIEVDNVCNGGRQILEALKATYY